MASVFKKQLKKRENRDDEEAGSTSVSKKNRQRVLLLSSRGITSRHNYLMKDLEAMLPHAKKDSKLDTKNSLFMLNELSDLQNCNNCIFFEARKGMDLYMWVSKTPNGPSAKFHVQNVHTMGELKMTGNCLKGSRPILSFDSAFDSAPHLQLLKELFTHMFAVPKTSRKVKPFIDHVTSLSIVDNRIWFRNYQIIEKDPTAEKEEKKTSLVEIGPRFCLNLIRIFEGSFGGPTLYENKEFISPNMIRSSLKVKHASKYLKRKVSNAERAYQLAKNKLPINPLDKAFA